MPGLKGMGSRVGVLGLVGCRRLKNNKRRTCRQRRHPLDFDQPFRWGTMQKERNADEEELH